MQDVIQVENQFYILASSSLADDRTRVLKYGETFLVFNRVGDIGGLIGEQGLFHRGMRHLSRYLMKLADRSPQLLRSTVRDDNAGLTLEVMNTDIYEGSRLRLPRGSLHLFRSMFLWDSVCYDKLRLSNFSLNHVESEVSLQFGADYADIFQVRGTKREHVGEMLSPSIEDDCLTLTYQGLDGISRRTRLEFSPAPSKLTKDSAQFSIHLDPREETIVNVNIVCEERGVRRRTFDLEHAMDETLRNIEHANSQSCRVTSSSPFFTRWLTRSQADLEMMIAGNPEGAYPYAGVPWYNTVFGRDGIITAMECLWAAPWIAASVLKYLAQTQAREVNPEEEAEPGKIVHEIRHGEMANLKEVPFGHYYGTVDATPLFVMLAGAYLERTGDRSLIRDIWPHILAALDWIDTYGDADHDGFVEYKAKSGKGLVHQGWKDSHDSISHQNGDLAQAPIALCEVQGYVYAARQAAARMAMQFGQVELAKKLSAQAVAIQEEFERKFWDEQLNTYVIALDGDKKPCRVLSSNPGHCLFSGVVSAERANRQMKTLMGEQLYCGWGIRTLGSGEVRYNPMSYHNGSVWPHDNAIIARGFARYGYKREASQILTALFDASMFMQRNRLPELFCGFHRRTASEGPTLYPVACSPQAWAAGASYLLLEACLGIDVNSSRGCVCFSAPYLPEMMNELQFTNLRLGAATIDVRLHRHHQDVGIEVLRNEGGVKVELEHSSSTP